MNAGHAQLPHGCPEYLRHCGMVCERSEIAALQWKIEQEPHHQRRTVTLLRGIDPEFHQKRACHGQRNVEWRDEAQVQPVGAFEGYSLTERPADRVRRN